MAEADSQFSDAEEGPYFKLVDKEKNPGDKDLKWNDWKNNKTMKDRALEPARMEAFIKLLERNLENTPAGSNLALLRQRGYNLKQIIEGIIPSEGNVHSKDYFGGVFRGIKEALEKELQPKTGGGGTKSRRYNKKYRKTRKKLKRRRRRRTRTRRSKKTKKY